MLVSGEEQAVDAELPLRSEAKGAMDAITRGTLEGVTLVINIVAMLIVIVALVALVNLVLAMLPDIAGAPLSLQRILGLLFAPLVWLMGIPMKEVMTAGSLMGIKTILNEFLAYLELARLPADTLQRSQPPDHDLRAVRVRQFRQPGHHAGRDRHHGPGTQR